MTRKVIPMVALLKHGKPIGFEQYKHCRRVLYAKRDALVLHLPELRQHAARPWPDNTRLAAVLRRHQTDTDHRESLYSALALEAGTDYTPFYIDSIDVPNQTFFYRQGERLLMRRWTVDSLGILHLDADIDDAQRSTTFTPVPDEDDMPGVTPTTNAAAQHRCDACGAYMARSPDAAGRTQPCTSCGWQPGDSLPTAQPLQWLPRTVPTTAAAQPRMTQARKQYLLDTWGVPPPPNTLDRAIAIQRDRGERP